MTVNMLLHNALTGLQTNQSALTHVSNNVANVNTPDYARRVVSQENQTVDGQSAGVALAEVRRAVDVFFTRQSIEAKADVGRYEAETRIHDRVQSMLGRPDDPEGLPARINRALASVADVLVDPSSSLRRTTYLSEVQDMAQGFSAVAQEIQAIRQDTDVEIASQIGTVNRLIGQVDDLNGQIRQQIIQGNDASGLLDQRDRVVGELGGFIDLRVQPQSDGTIHVTTTAGLPLVGAGRASLEYESPGSVNADTVFPPITISRTTTTGGTVNHSQVLDNQLAGGSLKGLIAMRDIELPSLSRQIGELAGVITDKLNAAHNDSIALPAPTALTGRDTGLIASDSINFTGRTSLAILDADGALAGRVDIDFDAGTVAANGSVTSGLGLTMSSLVSALDVALDTALGANGTVSLTNGVLSIGTGTTGLGIGFLQDETAPSARAGRGFSHYFGLNDLIRGETTAHPETGLDPTDPSGFTGQSIDLEVRDGEGRVLQALSYTVSGTSFANIVTDLNNVTTGLGAAATFALDANGRLTVTPKPGQSDVHVTVSADNTARVPSGMSLSSLLGIGAGPQSDRASGMSVTGEIMDDPSRLALAKLDLSPASVLGDTVASPGDNRGALALQAVMTSSVSFAAAGTAKATTTTISNYSGVVVGEVSNRAAAAQARATSAEALDTEVTARKSEAQGVNLDEELSNMIVFQQAYNASARMMTAARELYDQLLQLV